MFDQQQGKNWTLVNRVDVLLGYIFKKIFLQFQFA
jgi:hypothetical protein